MSIKKGCCYLFLKQGTKKQEAQTFAGSPAFAKAQAMFARFCGRISPSLPMACFDISSNNLDDLYWAVAKAQATDDKLYPEASPILLITTEFKLDMKLGSILWIPAFTTPHETKEKIVYYYSFPLNSSSFLVLP